MPCNTPPPLLDADEVEDDELMQDEEEDVEVIDLDELEGETTDDSVLTFTSHTDSVFCCNFSNNGLLAVSGGQDEKACIWDTNTGECKFECKGHTDSVISASFNHDSKLVATAGMEGLVQVWCVETGNKVWNFEATEITWMCWHPTENILFAGTCDGSCWKWSVPDGNTCDLFPAFGCTTDSGLLMCNGTKLVVGYADGSVRVWDTENISVCTSLTGNDAHSANVTAIASNFDNSLLVTGAEDGTAKLLKSTNCKVLHTWNCSDASLEEKETVECVGFFKSHPLVATGTTEGNLRIFDLSTNVERVSVNLDAPIIKLLCDDALPYVYTVTMRGVNLYDGRSAELIRRWEGHTLPLLDMALSPTHEKFVTASDDKTCKVYMM